jgi:hypothetical protein
MMMSSQASTHQKSQLTHQKSRCRSGRVISPSAIVLDEDCVPDVILLVPVASALICSDDKEVVAPVLSIKPGPLISNGIDDQLEWVRCVGPEDPCISEEVVGGCGVRGHVARVLEKRGEDLTHACNRARGGGACNAPDIMSVHPCEMPQA